MFPARLRSRSRNRSRNRLRSRSRDPARVRERSRSRNRSRDRRRSRSRIARRNRRRFFRNRPTIEYIPLHVEDSEVPAAAPEEPVFSVQLAHGSVPSTVPLFASLIELYQSVAEVFASEGVDSADSILFCTVNTPKVDMDHLLTANAADSDVLYVHVAGESRILSFIKTEFTIGVTISDNGAGRCFVKRVNEGGISARAGVSAGMQIAEIDGNSVVGLRHFDVARILRKADIGATISLRVVEPLSSGFSMLGPRGSRSARGATSTLSEATVKDGGMTLRLKADGRAAVVQGSQTDSLLPDAAFVGRVNDVFEAYLGVNDDQLAALAVEIATSSTTFAELKAQIAGSELAVFQLPEEFVFDLWGLMSDVRRASLPVVSDSTQDTLADAASNYVEWDDEITTKEVLDSIAEAASNDAEWDDVITTKEAQATPSANWTTLDLSVAEEAKVSPLHALAASMKYDSDDEEEAAPSSPTTERGWD